MIYTILAGVAVCGVVVLAYALCSVSPAEPEPDLSWMGKAERQMDDTAVGREQN